MGVGLFGGQLHTGYMGGKKMSAWTAYIIIGIALSCVGILAKFLLKD